MQLIPPLLIAVLFMHLAMLLAAAVVARTGNGGVTDVAWTFALGFAAVMASLLPVGSEAATAPRAWVITALISLWTLRLGLHLARRNLGGGEEDARYAELRRTWGTNYIRGLVRFLQAQALAAIPLILAVALAAHRPGAWPDLFDILGVIVFAVGLIGAWQADRTLSAFKASGAPRGAICDWGVWGWSRHPNYFFEWLGWCAWPLIAFDITGSYPQGLLALAAPALMYYLLVYVSGIPPLEEHMKRTRPAAFAAYSKTVPAFFPRPPA